MMKKAQDRSSHSYKSIVAYATVTGKSVFKIIETAHSSPQVALCFALWD